MKESFNNSLLLVVRPDLSNDTTRYAFDNLTKIYEYADISDHIYQGIDIVFFLTQSRISTLLFVKNPSKIYL